LKRPSPPASFRNILDPAGVLTVLVLTCAPAALPSESDSGCLKAVPVFLERREQGDSSATLLADLAQALECGGRTEEAVGATYLPVGQDTTGRIGLILVRAHLLRGLGLEDVARQLEHEVGADLEPVVAQVPVRSSWVADRRPSLSASLGWVDQVDHPRSAVLSRTYPVLLDSGLAGANLASQRSNDSIRVEGGSLQASANLSWGAWSDVGGFALGPSGSIAIPDDSATWRSATFGGDLNALFGPAPSTTLALSLSGSRTWFRATSGPMSFQDEVSGGLTPSWKGGDWTLSLPQMLKAQRTGTDPVGWSGQHSFSLGRALLAWLNATLTTTGAWSIDGSAGNDEDRGYQLRVEGSGFLPGQKLYPSTNNLGGYLDSTRLAQRIQSASDSHGPDTLHTPFYRNQSWTQFGLGAGIGLGPWRGLSGSINLGWNRTAYAHLQQGTYVDPYLAYSDSLGETLVFSDTTTHQDYVVRSISYRDSPELVPLAWSGRRRDQNWSIQISLNWKASPGIGARASWSGSRNVSNLQDMIEGSSYIRNVFSLSGTFSW